MKIIHTSDIYLGKRFTGFNLAGDRLRAGLKAAFSRTIDLANVEKADILIIAGNLFCSLDISNSLQNFVAAELARLETARAIIMPGKNDKYAEGSFWNTWDSIRENKNAHLLTDPQKPFVILDDLKCAVYGIYGKRDDLKVGTLSVQDTELHIGVMCCGLDSARVRIENSPIDYDYIALGGEHSFRDLSPVGLRASYSGSPENLNFDSSESGKVSLVEIEGKGNINIDAKQIGYFKWKNEEIQASEIITNEDLIAKILEHAGVDPENTAMRVKLTGLALFESDLNPGRVEEHLHDGFLFLDIIDNMKVLPENVSEVKVSEKTLLGQYIKILADELSAADDSQRIRLEQSAKVGLALLQGREIW